MSSPSVGRRRTRAAVGAIAAVALLGAGPAMSAVGQQAGSPGSTGARADLAGSATKAVPSNVKLLEVNTSLLGVHSWYRQMKGGYPVVGGLFARHVVTRGSTKGQVTIWDGRVTSGPLATTKVSVSLAAAIKAAATYTRGKPLTFVKPSLWVLPGATSHLVWGVTTVTSRGGYGASHVSYVDAASGKVLKSVVESKSDSGKGADPARYVSGKARVFDPNPVVKLQDENLTDQNDSDAAVPKSGYSTRPLGHLDAAKSSLIGKWANVVNPKDRATSKNFTYAYFRADDRFEQVMGYYSLDTEESYYQSLGFTDVNAESQDISTDSIPDDNSFYSPSQDLIVTGTGGVDDAEDPEVVWHEDGHATQDAQVPHFGQSEEAGAIGEGFGDWMAVTMGQIYSKSTDLTPTSCVMDWDSTSYTPPPVHCLRTTVTDKMYPDDLDGEVHDDGEIWSHALWNLSMSIGHNRAATTVLEAQFSFNPKINMPDAAALIVSTAKTLYGADAGAKATAAFHDRGIL
jgi:Zn-dependent metalloprotease